MVGKCIVKNCDNSNSVSRAKPSEVGFAFHRYFCGSVTSHTMSSRLRNLWKERLNLAKSYVFSSNDVICSLHFKPTDLLRKSQGVTLLKLGAIPMQQPASTSESSTESSVHVDLDRSSVSKSFDLNEVSEGSMEVSMDPLEEVSDAVMKLEHEACSDDSTLESPDDPLQNFSEDPLLDPLEDPLKNSQEDIGKFMVTLNNKKSMEVVNNLKFILPSYYRRCEQNRPKLPPLEALYAPKEPPKPPSPKPPSPKPPSPKPTPPKCSGCPKECEFLKNPPCLGVAGLKSEKLILKVAERSQMNRIINLKKEIETLKRKLREKEKLVVKYKAIIDKNKSSGPTLDEAMKDVPVGSRPIVNMILKRKDKPECSRRYGTDLKQFALNLRSISPKAYNYVRQELGLNLPHLRTLTKWRSDSKNNSEPVDKDWKAQEALLSLAKKLEEENYKKPQ
ncbi:uncharacterized protein LOC129794712 isoform X1 [Lutzomyia longipalpis]|uniref:uncharacterized protein LOC129794712 isoform X1 n=1 Tax=Lutzomyia longipalpis TaxID=7200 RepID=UPI0024837C0D|nr:uncharacterized protein LOC129794712 isoform X1 [Lutzomyia longipalpis]XP_055691536.1 uncharacterized protein LOC129794712 isoform X1 [Lutzomyia longipalpis]